LSNASQQISTTWAAPSASAKGKRSKPSGSARSSVFEEANTDAPRELPFEDDPQAEALLTLLQYELLRLGHSPGEDIYIRLMNFAMDQLRKARRPQPTIDALRKRFRL